MAVVGITIVDEDASEEVTCYCLKEENKRNASAFLYRAGKGDFSGWEKICSSHSEKTAKASW